MRILSAAAQNVFSQSGIEPVILVKIFWNGGNGIIYSDRKFEPYGFQGKLISVGTIDDTVNIDSSSSTAQVSVILDDTDGSLKEIFNQGDIHKVKVQLLQWCTDLSPGDTFVIFSGVISSPIEWKEGDRTLSFDVVTRVEDVQVGFSVECAYFPVIPAKLVGKAWPLVFGVVAGVPALQITESASLTLLESFAIIDEKAWKKEIDSLQTQQNQLYKNAADAQKKGYEESFAASKFLNSFPTSFVLSDLKDDPDQFDSHQKSADDYYAQAASYLDEAASLGRKISDKYTQLNEAKNFAKPEKFMAFSRTLPQRPVTLKLGSATITGTLIDNYFLIQQQLFPEDFNKKARINIISNAVSLYNVSVATSQEANNSTTNGEPEEFGQKFQWIDAGTTVKIQNYPLYYILSCNPITVYAVWGMKNGVRTIVPPIYYEIRPVNGYIELKMLSALSSRMKETGREPEPEGWDSDDIDVDCAGTLGPNPMDIILWVINTYTNFNVDFASFSATRAFVSRYPMNFALLQKKNIISFIQEIAFQSRCSVWISEETFYFRFLPQAPTPIDTITDDDVILNSLSVTCTETENVITSFNATWKPYIKFPDPYNIIFQYNVPKYGFHEETYDFYAYNNEESVMKAVQFWLIRRANTFKILKFKTAIHKIKIESFDAITIDLSDKIVSNNPVVGTVLKATYNTQDKTIDMEVWLPIRFGEMDVYKFAEPLLESTIYPEPSDPALSKRTNPFDAGGYLSGQGDFGQIKSAFIHYLGNSKLLDGLGKPITDFADPVNATSNNIVQTSPISISPSKIGDENIKTSNNFLKYKANPVTTPIVTPPANSTYPGIVVSTIDKAKQTYKVNTYLNGFDKEPTAITVKQFRINKNDEIAPDTPVEVKRLVYKTDEGIDTIFWMQATVWQTALIIEEEGSGGGTGDGSTGGGDDGGGTDDEGDESEDEAGDEGDVTDEGYPEDE